MSPRFPISSTKWVRRLTPLDSANTLGDLAALPGNRLEAFPGGRASQTSIRINTHWCIWFRWTDDRPFDVEIAGHRQGKREMSTRIGMRPMHPGEILGEELDELRLSANALSKALGVPVNRVTMILNGPRGMSADTGQLPRCGWPGISGRRPNSG